MFFHYFVSSSLLFRVLRGQTVEVEDACVYLLHYSFCLLEDIDDALIVFHILEAEDKTFAVFEPFLGGLITADVKFQADSGTPSKYCSLLI